MVRIHRFLAHKSTVPGISFMTVSNKNPVMRNNKEQNQKDSNSERQNTKAGATSQDFDRIAQEADKERSKKPGSQSNSSKQGNNGRGGGKS